jgi:hypothetical protein
MQNRFAGMNPNCAVRAAITQTTTLFAPATIHPCQNFLPIRMVERTVRRHEM